jgi:HD-like signal output (HDOD) protein
VKRPAIHFSAADPIPTFSGLVHYLASHFTEEEGTARKIIAAVYRDPAVCLRLLRLANSPYYGYQGRVGDPARAAEVIGPAALQAMTMGAPVFSEWERERAPQAVAEVWAHSYLTAMCARFIAESMKNVVNPLLDPPQIQAAALLHDLGKLLFLTRKPREYAALLKGAPNDAALEAEERGGFGVSHGEAGRLAAEGWDLPPLFSAAAAFVGRKGVARSGIRLSLEMIDTAHDLVLTGGARDAPGWIPRPVLDQAVQRLRKGSEGAVAFYRALCGPPGSIEEIEKTGIPKERDVLWR